MRIKLSSILTLVIILMIIGGCSKENHSMHSDEGALEPIQVNLQITPNEPSAGEPVTFEAKVTYGGENVDDAKEVIFEFWKEGNDDAKHTKVTVTSEGQGLYKHGETFLEPGIYYVISHVTAHDQHSMPMVKFTVK
ncbi:FixH family protein [Paenibacillus segetis]|uniref:YtkA-like domain-containing protein n=1 Tax=Paenibacillus segetis TaxID=1325360 RepID=A0ABQ1YE43_9BACL|nr:FixH family protein [Paenibacillus segetis]GGH22804.1 hypothetical protein GCM10008013_21470 [Paenibacillus segetis]